MYWEWPGSFLLGRGKGTHKINMVSVEYALNNQKSLGKGALHVSTCQPHIGPKLFLAFLCGLTRSKCKHL